MRVRAHSVWCLRLACADFVVRSHDTGTIEYVRCCNVRQFMCGLTFDSSLFFEYFGMF